MIFTTYNKQDNDNAFTGKEAKMFILLLILAIAGCSIFFTIKKRKPQFLLLPFLFLFIYFVVEIALVPAPFLDTVKFIFAIR
jgi:hypothetical protein